jgi:hypothetical protein
VVACFKASSIRSLEGKGKKGKGKKGKGKVVLLLN